MSRGGRGVGEEETSAKEAAMQRGPENGDEMPEQPGSINWMVTAFLGLLLSIVGSLLTPVVQRGLDRLSTARRARSTAKRRAEDERFERFLKTPRHLYLFLVGAGLRSAICFIIANALMGMGTISLFIRLPSFISYRLFLPVISVSATLFLLFSVYITFDTLRTVTRMRNVRED